MKRYESQTRPTAGCLSVPLFNQKKRSRLPMTSNPTENEFFSSNEHMSSQRPVSSNTSDARHYQNQTPGCSPAPALQNSQWNRQGNPQSHQHSQDHCSRPAPGPLGRGNAAPLPHPYKPGNTSLQMGQNNIAARLDSRVPTYPSQNRYANPLSSRRTQSLLVPPTGYPQQGQPSAYIQAKTQQSLQPQKARPLLQSGPPSASQQQNNTWKFKASCSTGPLRQPADNNNSYSTLTASQTQLKRFYTLFNLGKTTFQVKPATESSLRILTAVIDGMRHWSRFKDRTPYLFEIYATLDSAVTVGSHGAKNFFMRDGKEVVQCVFFENELELPRLIRGQVHRCVGNYDSRRDVLTCVSVRAARPSEQRNAQEAVKASDAEMRGLVKSISEV